VEDIMFAQLIASRAPQRRSPAGFAASIALHGIIVAGAVLLTSHVPMPRAPHAQVVMTYVAPVVRPRPATPVPPGAAPIATVPSIIGVPVTVPDVIPPIHPLRTAINTNDPFVFRIGVPSSAGTFAPGAADDPDVALLDSQVEVQVALDVRSPMPRYPQLLRDAGVEGETLVRFVVDTLGRVEQGTVHVVQTTHPAFALAVQAVLPQMRFAPARVGERKVRQLVEFPLQFRLKR
jgi:protein TonB